MLNATIKNSVPSIGIRSPFLNIRTSNFQTTKTGDLISPGTPMGLLLVLTYAETYPALGNYSDFRPNAGIRSM